MFNKTKSQAPVLARPAQDYRTVTKELPVNSLQARQHETLVKISDLLNKALDPQPKAVKNVVTRETYPSKRYIGKNDMVEV